MSHLRQLGRIIASHNCPRVESRLIEKTKAGSADALTRSTDLCVEFIGYARQRPCLTTKAAEMGSVPKTQSWRGAKKQKKHLTSFRSARLSRTSKGIASHDREPPRAAALDHVADSRRHRPGSVTGCMKTPRLSVLPPFIHGSRTRPIADGPRAKMLG